MFLLNDKKTFTGLHDVMSQRNDIAKSSEQIYLYIILESFNRPPLYINSTPLRCIGREMGKFPTA
jgi:hypothetical protein